MKRDLNSIEQKLEALTKMNKTLFLVKEAVENSTPDKKPKSYQSYTPRLLLDTAFEVNCFAPKTTSPTSTTTISTTTTFAWDGSKFTTLGFIQNGSARE